MPFDRVIMVDWSAKCSPTRTKEDSIWITDGTGNKQIASTNCPTRSCAYQIITEKLADALDRKQRVLLGFDFAFGYPAGFAATSLPGSGDPWRRIWKWVDSGIKDNICGNDNKNNRFDFANDFNKRQSKQYFSRLHNQSATPCLDRNCSLPKPTIGYWRQTEQRAGWWGAKSIWDLYSPGAVGSQSLMGIKYMERLRAQFTQEDLQVWPFQTGFVNDPLGASNSQIVLAEIFPSMWAPPSKCPDDQLKDEWQVQTAVSEVFDQQNAPVGLTHWFNPSYVQGLQKSVRTQIEKEEGWMLGLA